MPTPMYVFSEIAARYGADPNNEEEVEYFWQTQMATKTVTEKEAILQELLERDGEKEPGEANEQR